MIYNHKQINIPIQKENMPFYCNLRVMCRLSAHPLVTGCMHTHSNVTNSLHCHSQMWSSHSVSDYPPHQSVHTIIAIPPLQLSATLLFTSYYTTIQWHCQSRKTKPPKDTISSLLHRKSHRVWISEWEYPGLIFVEACCLFGLWIPLSIFFLYFVGYCHVPWGLILCMIFVAQFFKLLTYNLKGIAIIMNFFHFLAQSVGFSQSALAFFQ